jgi:hypothetical protein
MPTLLKWPSLPCHSDDTGMSMTNKLHSLSVTYRGYNECIFGPRASRRFPLGRLHPLEENMARMHVSSSYPTEISDLESFGTCQISWSTIVEPPGRLNFIVLMLMTAQCCEFPTRIESKLRAIYFQNCNWKGVTW